jgi:hypothetical protein
MGQPQDKQPQRMGQRRVKLLATTELPRDKQLAITVQQRVKPLETMRSMLVKRAEKLLPMPETQQAKHQQTMPQQTMGKEHSNNRRTLNRQSNPRNSRHLHRRTVVTRS